MAIQELQAPKRDSASLTILEITSHLKSLGYPEKALYDYQHCGEMSSMYLLASCHCSSYPIHVTRQCNKRFCLSCAEKRKRRLKKKLQAYLFYFPPDSLYSYKFLTISPKNYDDSFSCKVPVYEEKLNLKTGEVMSTKTGTKLIYGLEAGLYHLKTSFSRFLRRKYIRERIKGGFAVIEGTNHKEGEPIYDENGDLRGYYKGGWHLHIHAILFSRKLDNTYNCKCPHCSQHYLKWDRIGQNFYCATRKCNKVYIGDVPDSKLKREFVACSGRDCRTDISQVSSREKVINYCLKYVTIPKDSFQDTMQYAQFINATYNTRLISPFGIFSGNKSNSQYSSFSKFIKNYKKVCICPLCNSQIKFQFDPQISAMINESCSKVPPPQQELYCY